MFDLICVGEMVVDFLPGEEQGIYIRKAGGAPANVAIAAARNGLKTGFCGRVGGDDFGRFLFQTLQDNSVTVLCPDPVPEATTTMAFVTLYPGGERSFTFARKPGADMFLTKADIDAAGVREAGIVHAGSCSLSKPPASGATAYALAAGAAAGRLVSFDVNYRDLLWDGDRSAARQAVNDVLPYVDLLKLSEEELDFAGGEANIPAMAERYKIAAVVVTLGARGAHCYWNGRTIFAEGFLAGCVDATGAGDAFWGAFLSRLVRGGVKRTAELTGELLREAMVYGNLAGRLCVQKKGAIESLPAREQIEALRKELAV
ncbi:MAG TPA: carbohydrate kinase [Feifaniaceae bacterium]|nr:carbohydrate kinase [Feifaniaceae bacterium]